MNARVLTAVVVAAVVVLATAEPLVQVRKGATPLADGKPNTFRVDLAFRVVEEAGEDAGKRVVSVAESLPETVSLVSGELARKFTVDSVEVDAAPMDGWTSMEYVVCADKVKFTLRNLTFGVVIPPSRISVLASEEDNADVVVSDYSEPLALRAVFPMPKASVLFVLVFLVFIVLVLFCFSPFSFFLFPHPFQCGLQVPHALRVLWCGGAPGASGGVLCEGLCRFAQDRGQAQEELSCVFLICSFLLPSLFFLDPFQSSLFFSLTKRKQTTKQNQTSIFTNDAHTNSTHTVSILFSFFFHNQNLRARNGKPRAATRSVTLSGSQAER